MGKLGGFIKRLVTGGRTTKRGKRDATWSLSSFLSGFGKAYAATDKSMIASESLAGPAGSANVTIGPALDQLTRTLRQLKRNNDTIRAMVNGHRSDIVGCGCSVIPKTGNPEIDSKLKEAWNHYRKHIGTAGESDVELQRIWCGEWDVSGNMLGRIVIDPKRKSANMLPVGIMPFEVSWLAKNPVQNVEAGNSFINGIESSKFGIPRYYHIVNNDTGASDRVPAEEIIHGFEHDRPGQNIGEPNLVACIQRASQRGRLIDTEIISAINACSWTTQLKSSNMDDDDTGFQENETDTDANSDGTTGGIVDVRPGDAFVGNPGEELELLQSTRPNTDVSVFASALDGGLAAAGRTSKVWLDRDGSKYNFANAKFDQIRSKMVIKPIQDWMFPSTESRIYEACVPYLFLVTGMRWPESELEQQKMLGHKLQPDVPPELDELASYEALEIGLEACATTLEQYHGERGRDWEEVMLQRSEEIAAQKAINEDLGLTDEDLTDEDRKAKAALRRKILKKEHGYARQ